MLSVDPAVTAPADPRIDALAERLYGLGFGPLDARRNVARGYLAAVDAVDPLRAVLDAEPPTCTCTELLKVSASVEPCPTHGLTCERLEEVCDEVDHQWVCRRCYVGRSSDREIADEHAARPAAHNPDTE